MSYRDGKENINKEKVDRQTAGQTSIPFMSIRDGLNKRVTFNSTDNIEWKIDKLMVMMDKLVTGEGQNKPFKLQVYQSNGGRGQTRYNYDQRRYEGIIHKTNTVTSTTTVMTATTNGYVNKLVRNLLGTPLTEAQVSLLVHGPNFAVAPRHPPMESTSP